MSWRRQGKEAVPRMHFAPRVTHGMELPLRGRGSSSTHDPRAGPLQIHTGFVEEGCPSLTLLEL